MIISHVCTDTVYCVCYTHDIVYSLANVIAIPRCPGAMLSLLLAFPPLPVPKPQGHRGVLCTVSNLSTDVMGSRAWMGHSAEAKYNVGVIVTGGGRLLSTQGDEAKGKEAY